MMFLYEAYKNPKQKSIQTGTTPMIEDISSRSATSINDVPKDSADALERAESIMGHLKSSDNLLLSVDSSGSKKNEVKNESTSPDIGSLASPGSLDLSRNYSLALSNAIGDGDQPLFRQESFPALEDALKSTTAKDRSDYLELARNMDRHLSDQDNTLQRLETVESMVDDPLDSFLEHTSPAQIGSLLDLDTDKSVEEATKDVQPDRKKRRTS